jgi:hypothetical protein
MKKLIVFALGVFLLTSSCKKEETKEVEVIEEIKTAFTADINGTSFSFSTSSYIYYNFTNSKSFYLVATNENNKRITATINVSEEGQTGEFNSPLFIYKKSEQDTTIRSFQGSLTLNAWDTNNDIISGTFNFTVFDGQDSIHIKNGVFTKISAQ